MKGATEVLKDCVKKDILLGLCQSEIADKIVNDKYGVNLSYTTHAAASLISNTRKSIKEEWQEENNYLRETMLQRLMNLYNICLNNKDRNCALNTLKEINKITGMYEPDKLNLNIDSEVNIDFGFEN